MERTCSNDGRMGQKAPRGTAKLTGREPDEESISSSNSLSEEEEDVGERSGVELAE